MPLKRTSRPERTPDRAPDNEIKRLTDDSLIYRSLSQVARRLPPNRGNKPVHPATLTRWILEGVVLSDGSRIKLRAVRFPSAWLTTDTWVEDFLEAITADRMGEKPAPIPARERNIRTPAKRRREQQARKAS